MPSKTILVGPSGDRVPVTGEARVTIRGESKNTDAAILVVERARLNLLGRSGVWDC